MMRLSSAIQKYRPGLSSGSSSAEWSSKSNSSSNSNRSCERCKPNEARGWWITDYDVNSKTYPNGRYILRPGYKRCSVCKGTGNCKVTSSCSSSQERDGNYTCYLCHGDRFVLCDYCKGSGRSN